MEARDLPLELVKALGLEGQRVAELTVRASGIDPTVYVDATLYVMEPQHTEMVKVLRQYKLVPREDGEPAAG